MEYAFLVGVIVAVVIAVYLQKAGFTRDGKNNVFGGVCAGVANHYAIPVAAVRIVWFVLTLTAGVGLGVYIILWLILPEAKS